MGKGWAGGGGWSWEGGELEASPLFSDYSEAMLPAPPAVESLPSVLGIQSKSTDQLQKPQHFPFV